jgi:uncharacterized membrane protein
LALSAVAVTVLVTAIWLGQRLTYQYGMRVSHRADSGGSS